MRTTVGAPAVYGVLGGDEPHAVTCVAMAVRWPQRGGGGGIAGVWVLCAAALWSSVNSAAHLLRATALGVLAHGMHVHASSRVAAISVLRHLFTPLQV